MAVNPIIIDVSLALGSKEMMTAYLSQDRKLISLIKKYRSYNKEYYIQHRGWLRVSPTPYPPQSEINIKTQQLIGDSEVVQEACGLSPVEVLHFDFLLFGISRMFREFMRKYQNEREKFQRIEELMLQRGNPFSSLITCALKCGFQKPEVDLGFITEPIRKRVTKNCITLVQILQRADSFEKLQPSTVARKLFGRDFPSSIEVQWTDNAFEALEDWLGQEWVCKKSTRRLATTGSRLPWNKNESGGHEEHILESTPPRTCSLPRLTLTPANGKHWFMYGRHLILLIREEREDTWGRSRSLHLKCFGWDGFILRKILHAARLRHAELDENKTAVYHARYTQKSIGWTRLSGQGIRPLSTVIMDPSLQNRLIKDIDGYLRPETKMWHNRRGIPYRQGYLFEGPPGTGKTSLCIALAGRFKLKIYILNLSGIADVALNDLMSSLPERCILLLEDIDSQKITNPRTAEPDNSATGQRLTLSGLLNAMDGVIASEGRILIMTTNHKNKLDPALIRPGRVDMTVSFEYPDSDGIKRLFFLMYAEHPVEEQEEKREQQLQHASPQCQICPKLLPFPPANIPRNDIPGCTSNSRK
uniref:Putative mitochondrial chaperone BCS1-B n=1 Tax=Talaromyces marneffei PM1 TaxID=1077442 RepID=A0A093VHC2_TALMA